MTLTHYGKDVWLKMLAIAVILDVLVFCSALMHFLNPLVASVMICAITLIWLAAVSFFRDPKRKITTDPALVLSPADGTVRDIELIKSESVECEELRDLFQGQDMLRVGIFLSVFSVHINRVPLAMKIKFRHYKKGAFHDARDGAAIRENEAMTIGGICEIDGVEFPIAIKQVSGAIARRIVCPVEAGDTFDKGAQYGMIKFGSRTELYLPCQGFDIVTKIGNGVCGGTSTIARILPDAKDKLSQLFKKQEQC